MPTSTYVPLATFSGSGVHAFTNIPQTYDHLVIVNYGKLTTAGPDNLQYQVGNGSYDSGTNYTYKFYGANNSGTYGTGANVTTAASILCGAIDSSYFSVSTLTILNYKSTSMQKNFIARNAGYNTSGQSNAIWGGSWKTTGTAINQIQTVNSFATGSRTTIYGLVAQ
jgi:hypothetical protein